MSGETENVETIEWLKKRNRWLNDTVDQLDEERKRLRAENERLKADLAEARRVSLHDDVKYVQLERVNAELRAKLKSIVDVIESRTKDGLTRFCADPACNCESSGAYQDLKALEKGEASTADRA